MNNTWKKNFAYLDIFEYRIDKMLSLLNLNSLNSIMDLGCGMQTLKKKLNDKIHYIGIDQYNHINSSIIVDFNNGEFYNENVDIIFCSGILEYIYNMEEFIKNISNNTDIIIFSYYFIEDCHERAEVWVNSYDKRGLLSLFYKYGFSNIVLLSNMKYFDNTIITNFDNICILTKPQYNEKCINFNKINEIKNNEYFSNLYYKIDNECQNINNNINYNLYTINYKLNRIIDSIAWWIPIRKWRDNFRNKILHRPDQTRPDQTRPDQTNM
ncbi:hypothetical protein [Brachyspira murdochii]|uniref:hypothetical protein n=1 Tax=Brachyspira murdochii TaxID=84378 RepID=UPI0018DEFA3F|nr:hypothetical protein [Brachyspira murdochii]